MQTGPATVVVKHTANQGVVVGLLGCLFGILGIFTFGLIFVPLAAICSLIGLLRAAAGVSFAGLGISVLAGALAVWGFIVSPSLWVLVGSGILAQHVSAPDTRARSATVAPMPNGSTAASQDIAEKCKQASEEAKGAATECKNKRLSGELKTHVASAQCSNPRIITAFEKANYQYMDLIYVLTAKRRELEERMDHGTLSEAQAELEASQFTVRLADEERKRDSGQR